nr:MAG TPA: hypothetical protein [Caudoviricetes sp.]
MITRNTSSGAPLHHYDMAEIQKERQAALKNGSVPLNRKQRRKQKRKLDKIIKKYGGYIERG